MRTRTRTTLLAGHANVVRPIRLPLLDTMTVPERPQATATESVLRVLPDHRTSDPITRGTFPVDGGDTGSGGVDDGGGDTGSDGGGPTAAGGVGAPRSSGMKGSDGGAGPW